MKEITQNQWEHIKDQVLLGNMTIAESHVEQVKLKRVLLVTNSLSKVVRAALNGAVKMGDIGHVKKTKDYPEAYYHTSFKNSMEQDRKEYKASQLRALRDIVR